MQLNSYLGTYKTFWIIQVVKDIQREEQRRIEAKLSGLSVSKSQHTPAAKLWFRGTLRCPTAPAPATIILSLIF